MTLSPTAVKGIPYIVELALTGADVQVRCGLEDSGKLDW